MIHKKRAKFMNFSFWPFLWFGLQGRLLTKDEENPNPKAENHGNRKGKDFCEVTFKKTSLKKTHEKDEHRNRQRDRVGKVGPFLAHLTLKRSNQNI